MKIIFFHHGHARGGAPVSLLFLLRQLKILKVDCDLVDTLCMSEVRNLYESDSRNVVSRRIFYYPHSTLCWLNLASVKDILRNIKWLLLYPLGCLNLFRCLIGTRYDVVHFNSATLTAYSWIPKLLGMKLVCHIREPFATGKFGIRRMLLRRGLSAFTDHCIAICKDNANDTGLPAERVSVVYNPVDFNQFHNSRVDQEASRGALGVADDAFVTLFAGGSNATVKGVSDYLRAMEIVAKSAPKLVCLMPSLEEDRLDDESARKCLHSLGERVIRSDFVRDIEKWIAASNVVYALHQTPHFSRTIMEAGAMKRVVVATEIPGISEVVCDGYNGVLCPVGDVDAVVQATLKLYDDPILAARFGEGGYEQAFRLFRVESHGEAVLGVYRRMLGEPEKI